MSRERTGDTAAPPMGAEARAARRRLRAAAHEIRTPLGGIVAIADILAGQDLPEPARGYVDLLREAARHLAAVANDILDLGRLEADLGLGPRETYAPEALITSAVALARPRAEAKGLDLAFTAHGLPDRLHGHPMLVRRIVENLIDNALKHGDTGSIRVEASFDDVGGLLTLAVRDSGPGIAPEDRERLFEPYAQLVSGERAGGTGLGLALVKAGVERLGGSIAIESEPGEGAAFIVTLPVAAARPGAAAPVRGEARAPRPLDILVADDHPMARRLVAATLESFGHRVETVSDGRAAIAAVKAGDYDLVLLDLDMPGFGGSEALAAIRALPGGRGRVPVGALSAGEVGTEAAALAAGFDFYTAKPLNPAALWAAARPFI